MAYAALYRTWRPHRFRDVVGQTHVVRALQNAVKTQRLGHAYLFFGPRGTGKTSLARILAQVVNCAAPVEGEPCGDCPSCRSVELGQSPDVIEVDAASNRGIDEIRDLRERTRLAPVQGRRRVYIIDEVHMLTPEAHNALLKTLEEPPPHLLFLMATTEADRLPATILSRVQRFGLHRLPEGAVARRLQEVAREEGREGEAALFAYLASQADGALRDALGLLEQVMAYGEHLLTVEQAVAVLGGIRQEAARDLTAMVVAGDREGVLRWLQEVLEGGAEVGRVLSDLTRFWEGELWRLVSGEGPLLLRSPQEAERGLTELLRARSALRLSPDPQVTAKLHLLALCAPAPEPARPAEARRIPPPAPAPAPAVEPAPRRSQGATWTQLWPQVLRRVRERSRPASALLGEAEPQGAPGPQVVLEFRYPFHRQEIEKPEHRKLVEEALGEMLGQPVSITCRMAEGSKNS